MRKSILQVCLMMCTCSVINVANAYTAKMEDPLRPPEYRITKSDNSPGVKNPAWHVNEILFSGGRRVAIVNNVSVVPGDHINGARVVDIKPEHVVLKYKDRIFDARLNTISVKKKLK